MTSPKRKTHTLQQAASVVFALTAMLPLLMFTYTLLRLNGLRELQDQVTLVLALLAALVGFYIFRAMISRTSDLLRAMDKATEQGEVLALPRDNDLRVPAIGRIQEFQEVAETVDHLWAAWKAEAEPYLGRRVLVTVRNSPHPIAGTLVEVSDEGVLLEENATQVAVSYRRVSGIEADRPLAA